LCELFAMSSRYPTSVGFSLEVLARRGGYEGPNKDGWGVAYFEGNDAFVLREPRPAAESGLVQFMEKNGPPSKLVLSHIRHATQGAPALRNTQPFQRELAGRVHVFAHNGTLPAIREQCQLRTLRYRPVGETDSELAFCCLLERLEAVWSNTNGVPPPIEARLEIVADFAEWLRPLGPFNFTYADGDTLFAHSHRRTQSDGQIRPPGLHMLVRSCNEQAIDLSQSGIMMAPIAQELTLVASVPLTGEAWRPIAEGDVIAVKEGMVRAEKAAA
jgi:predicted glutamine amidotransferase